MGTSLFPTLFSAAPPEFSVPERVRRAIYHGIAPDLYPNLARMPGHAAKVVQALVTGRMSEERWEFQRRAALDLQRLRLGKSRFSDVFPGFSGEAAVSEDAWAQYLGLKQPFGTIKNSLYKPGRSRESGTAYYTSDVIRQQFDQGSIRAFVKSGYVRYGATNFSLGKYRVERGEDESGPYISFYDVWDFSVPGERAVGKPFEIYDRVYYDPKTFEPKSPAQVARDHARIALEKAMRKRER